jgi:hypothetical protein
MVSDVEGNDRRSPSVSQARPPGNTSGTSDIDLSSPDRELETEDDIPSPRQKVWQKTQPYSTLDMRLTCAW